MASNDTNSKQKGFDASLAILKENLPYVEDPTFSWKDAISILVIKLSNTDSINKANEASNATQIQLTSERDASAGQRKTEDFFPTLTLNSTFKGWRISVPVRLNKNNLEALDADTTDFSAAWKKDQVQIRRRILNTDENGNGNPTLQICYGNDLMPLRKALGVEDYIVFVKRKDASVYEVFGVLKSVDLGKGKKMYVSDKADKDSTNFSLTDITLKTDDDIYLNEYQRAARYLRSYVAETGFDIPAKKQAIEEILNEFNAKFSPEILATLSDDELLNYLFYTVGENKGSLCCWLEMNCDCRRYFGSIAGGSAYKFGLFQKQKTGEWTTGSPQKPQVLTEDEALEVGRHIRDALVRAAQIVQSATLESITDYEKLDADLWKKVGEPYCNWGWFHKYLSMVCPDKLSSFHSSDWQKHILYALKIKPSEKYFVRSGQIAMIEKYAGWYCGEFEDVIFERFGSDIIQFVRIGTFDNEKNYAAEWNKKSVIGIGWRDIGSLENFVAGDGLDKDAISKALKEKYGYVDNVASRKAGELIRFYKLDSNSVVVAMDGESLLAFVDDIGNYFYDATSAMANMKPGTWHRNFASGEHLPVKTEGKLTSCYSLTNEENLMFLYERYYYGSEEIIDGVDEIEFDNPEERNKRNFRAWMETQVKPKGESDAGQPYTENAINQYVSIIANTPLPSHEDHSVFFTIAVDEVENCILTLEMSEKKEYTQRSAVKKYLMYLRALQEVNMPLVYNTDLETDYERNRIVFGAPGTGKSFKLKTDCEKFLKDTTGSYERVTFYPDYTYSQFVGTYKPVSEDSAIRYEFVPGPFMRVYVEAMKSARSSEPQPYILIIEEINRARVAAVFGDVFQLLDRDDDGVSEYEIQTSEDIRRYLAKELKCDVEKCNKIKIPNNMFIWATMNSADQGVFPMDTAFKRRWNFEYLGINEKQDKIKGRVMVGSNATQEIEWNVLRRAINEKLAKEYKVNEDKLMGPFFISKNVLKTVSEEDDTIMDATRFIEIFKSKVIMYLYEDAAKQHKHKLFSGCEDTTKYSAVCDSFDKIGIQIFGEDFEEVYYNPQKG